MKELLNKAGLGLGLPLLPAERAAGCLLHLVRARSSVEELKALQQFVRGIPRLLRQASPAPGQELDEARRALEGAGLGPGEARVFLEMFATHLQERGGEAAGALLARLPELQSPSP